MLWPDSSRLFIDHQAVASTAQWIRSPLFDSTGTLLANWVSDGEKQYIEYYTLENVPDLPDYYSVSTPWLSANGQHVVADLSFNEQLTDNAFLVDGKLLERRSCDGNSNIGFSEDGSQFFTTCFIGEPMQMTISVNDTYGPYSGIWIDPIVFSPDGKHWAARQILNKSVRLIIDGDLSDVKPVCSRIRFSPDSNHMSYTISDRKKEKETLYISDIEICTYSEIRGDEIEFSPNGSLTFFGREKDKKLYRVTITPQ